MGKLKKQKNKDSAHSFQRIETAWPNLVQRPWLNLVSHKPFKEMSDDENQRKMCSSSIYWPQHLTCICRVLDVSFALIEE